MPKYALASAMEVKGIAAGAVLRPDAFPNRVFALGSIQEGKDMIQQEYVEKGWLVMDWMEGNLVNGAKWLLVFLESKEE